MAVPTIVGVGASAAGQAGITPAFPASYTAVADDIALTWRECDNADTVTIPSGWALVTGGSVGVGSGTTTKLSVIWRRLQAGDTAPTLADAGNHQVGRMIVVRGCIATGDPWDIVVTNTELTADTSVSIPGGTTTVADCLCLAGFSTGQDISSTAGASAWANASLANGAEQMDNWTALGTGGGFALWSGEKATAGTVNATTATLGLTANFKALMLVALKPEPPATTLTVADAAQSHTADNLVLTQVHVLAVADAAQAETADTLALTQVHNLVVQDTAQSHTADNVVLTTGAVDLVVQDATHSHTADSPTLTQVHQLAVADASQSHTVDNLTLTQAHQLAVQDAAQSQTVDNVTLTQLHQLTVADAAQSETADNLVLTQVHQLAVADATHSHAVDNVVLGAGTTLTVADATHSHTADNVTLTQVHQLAVADASQSHTVDNVTVTVVVDLTVADAAQSHTADNLVLTQVHVLAVLSAVHAHTADNLVLTQVHQLTVADASQAHTADNVTFVATVVKADSTPQVLVGVGATHAVTRPNASPGTVTATYTSTSDVD